jgi:hypothetical protein
MDILEADTFQDILSFQVVSQFRGPAIAATRDIFGKLLHHEIILQTPANSWENLDDWHLICPNITSIITMSKAQKPIVAYQEVQAQKIPLGLMSLAAMVQAGNGPESDFHDS